MNVGEAIQNGIEAGTMLHHKDYSDADHQLAWLWVLAALAPDGTAVECGVWKGGSIVTWASARKGRGRVIAVDNWYGNPQSLVKQIFLTNRERFCPEVELLEAESYEAPSLIEGAVAFCFIDANHGEDGIPFDIVAWPAKIAPGGILAFHDYDVWKPGVVVKRDVDQWQAREPWERLGIIGSLIAYRKPGGSQ